MDIKPPKSKQPIPENAKKVFEGKVFDVYQWEQELYDGTTTIFEKVKRPDTVIIFPVLDNGRILLLKEMQPGKNPYIAAPGGRIDEGEDVLSAAKRELLEETGYEAKEFVLWDAQQPLSKIEWSVYTFIAKGLTKISDQNIDGGEKIELIEETLDELIDTATSKEYPDRQLLMNFVEAKYNPDKKEELRKLFSIKH